MGIYYHYNITISQRAIEKRNNYIRTPYNNIMMICISTIICASVWLYLKNIIYIPILPVDSFIVRHIELIIFKKIIDVFEKKKNYVIFSHYQLCPLQNIMGIKCFFLLYFVTFLLFWIVTYSFNFNFESWLLSKCFLKIKFMIKQYIV